MNIRLFNVKYSPNLGDGLLAECLERALTEMGASPDSRSVDLSARTAYSRGHRYRTLILRFLLKVPPALRPHILKLPLAVLAYARWVPHYRKSLRGADAIVIGGGNLITDADLNFPTKFARVLHSASHLDLPVVIYGCGVSDQWSPKGIDLLRRGFARTRVIKVALRDSASRKNWDSIFGSCAEVASEVVWDPAILVSRYKPAQPGARRNKTIGLGIISPLALRYHSSFSFSDDALSQWYKGMISAIQDAGYKALLFTNGSPEDVEFLNLFAHSLPVKIVQPDTPDALANLIASFDGLIAHRLHAIIPAYSYHIPLIALRWDPKLSSFMDSVKLSHRCFEAVMSSPSDVIAHLLDPADRTIAGEGKTTAVREALEQVRALVGTLGGTRKESAKYPVPRGKNQASRTLFVTHCAEMGGAELFLRDLISYGPRNWAACFLSEGPLTQSLAAEGHDIIKLSAKDRLLSIRRNSSINTLLSSMTNVVSLARELSGHAARYDIVCANSLKSLFVAGLAAAMARKPFVWIVHDILTHRNFGFINRKAVVLFANRFCRLIVANSKETAAALIAAGARPKLARVVYNGFDPGRHPRANAEASSAVRKAFNFDGRPVIGLFGRLAEWKGQHILLHALSALPGVQALIVGGPLFREEKYEMKIKQLTTELNLNDRVRFSGLRDDVSALMAGVDIVLHTSIYPEPFGRVIVEGMLAQKPVIAARGGATAEIIEDGVTGFLVPPNDPSLLAQAVSTILNRPQKAQAVAEAGYKSVVSRYSINKTCEDLASILEQAKRGV